MATLIFYYIKLLKLSEVVESSGMHSLSASVVGDDAEVLFLFFNDSEAQWSYHILAYIPFAAISSL